MQEMKNHKMIALSEGSVSLSYHENTEDQFFENYLISITRSGISVALHLTKEDFKLIASEMKKFKEA